jgi:hypothetical protein
MKEFETEVKSSLSTIFIMLILLVFGQCGICMKIENLQKIKMEVKE